MAIANSNHSSRRSNLGASSLFAVGGTQSTAAEEQGYRGIQHHKLMMSVAAATGTTVASGNSHDEPSQTLPPGEDRSRENSNITRGGDAAAGGVQRCSSASEDGVSFRGSKAFSKTGKMKSPLSRQTSRKSRKSNKSSSTSTMSAIERAKHALDLSRHSTASRSQTTISSITGLGESFIGRGTSVYTDPGDDDVDDADDEIQTVVKDGDDDNDSKTENKNEEKKTTRRSHAAPREHDVSSSGSSTSSFNEKNVNEGDDNVRGKNESPEHFRSTSSYRKLLANMDDLSVSAAANSHDTEYDGSGHNDDISSTYSSCLTPFTTGSTFANDEDDRMSRDGSMSSLPLYSGADGRAEQSTDEEDGSMSRTISGNSTTQHARNMSSSSEFRTAQRNLVSAGHRLAGLSARTSLAAATADDGTSPYASSFNSRDTEVNRSDWAKIQLEQENCRLVLELHRSMEKERQLSDMADLLTKQMRKTLKENDELTQGIQDLINTCETLEETKRDLQDDVDELHEENEILRQTVRQMELQRKRERLQLQQYKMKDEEQNRDSIDKSETSRGAATREDGTELSSLTNEQELKKRSKLSERLGAEEKANQNDIVKELQEQLVALAKDNTALLNDRSKMLQKLRFSDLQLDDYAHQLQVLQLQQQEVKRLHHFGGEEEDRPLIRSVSHEYELPIDNDEAGEAVESDRHGDEKVIGAEDFEGIEDENFRSENERSIMMGLRSPSIISRHDNLDVHQQLNSNEHEQYYAGDAVSMLTFDVPQCTAVEVTEDEASVEVDADEDEDLHDVERKLAKRREGTRHKKNSSDEKNKKSKRKNKRSDKKVAKQDKADHRRNAGEEESEDSRSESEEESESRTTSTGGTNSRVTKPGQATTDEVESAKARDGNEGSISETCSYSSASSEHRNHKRTSNEVVEDLKDELSQCKMEIMCLTQLLKQERQLQNAQSATPSKSKKSSKARTKSKMKPTGYNDGNQASFFAGGGYVSGERDRSIIGAGRRNDGRKSGCSSVVLCGTSVDEELSKQERQRRSSSAHPQRRHPRQGQGHNVERPPASPTSSSRFALLRAASSVIAGGASVDPSKTVRFISNASQVSNSSLYSSLTPPSASGVGSSNSASKAAAGPAGSNGEGTEKTKDDLALTLRGGTRTSGTVRRSHPDLHK